MDGVGQGGKSGVGGGGGGAWWEEGGLLRLILGVERIEIKSSSP